MSFLIAFLMAFAPAVTGGSHSNWPHVQHRAHSHHYRCPGSDGAMRPDYCVRSRG